MTNVQHQISQRDLRLRSKDIMDAVEHGQKFSVTRDGREIAELVPVQKRRTFVSAEDFYSASTAVPGLDLERFRADLDGVFDPAVSDPYDR